MVAVVQEPGGDQPLPDLPVSGGLRPAIAGFKTVFPFLRGTGIIGIIGTAKRNRIGG